MCSVSRISVRTFILVDLLFIAWHFYPVLGLVLPDAGLLSTKRRVSATEAFIGCFKVSQLPSDSVEYTVNRVNASFTPEYCINYCTYIAKGGGKYDLAGIMLYEYTSSCYCSNKVATTHEAVDIKKCFISCDLYANRGQICMNDNTALLYGTCPAGYIVPPFCVGECAEFCRNTKNQRERPCSRGNECVFGCISGSCEPGSFYCQNISGMANIFPKPKPYELHHLPAQFLILHDIKFSSEGRIRLVNFFAKIVGSFILGVWRYVNNDVNHEPYWYLVGKVKLTAETYGYNHRILEMKEWVHVQAGDVAAVHQLRTSMMSVRAYHRRFATVLGALRIPLYFKTPFTFSNTSGKFSFISDEFDDKWSPGKTFDAKDLKTGDDSQLFVPLEIGIDCPCSEHCNKALCEVSSGRCLHGCTPGYLGSRCDKQCQDGYFGDKCEMTCSIRCLNKVT